MAKVASYAALSQPNLLCRSLGHAWEPEMAELVRNNRREDVLLHLTCVRCSTTRKVQIVRKTGERVRSGYKYTDGYLLEKAASWGTKMTINNNMRLELIRRLEK